MRLFNLRHAVITKFHCFGQLHSFIWWFTARFIIKPLFVISFTLLIYWVKFEVVFTHCQYWLFNDCWLCRNRFSKISIIHHLASKVMQILKLFKSLLFFRTYSFCFFALNLRAFWSDFALLIFVHTLCTSYWSFSLFIWLSLLNRIILLIIFASWVAIFCGFTLC